MRLLLCPAEIWIGTIEVYCPDMSDSEELNEGEISPLVAACKKMA
jgi:hypothetical protein